MHWGGGGGGGCVVATRGICHEVCMAIMLGSLFGNTSRLFPVLPTLYLCVWEVGRHVS